MVRTERRLFAAIALCMALGLVVVALAQRAIDGPTSASSAPSRVPVDPGTDAAATTAFGEQLVVRRDGRVLGIWLATPEGLRRLAEYDLPVADEYVVGRQLVCAEGTGPERSLIVFGATSPAPVVGSMWMELFDGRFTRTSTGLFLFIGSEPPIGGKAWVLKIGQRTIVSDSVVLAMPADPDDPPAELCDDFDPARTG